MNKILHHIRPTGTETAGGRRPLTCTDTFYRKQLICNYRFLLLEMKRWLTRKNRDPKGLGPVKELATWAWLDLELLWTDDPCVSSIFPLFFFLMGMPSSYYAYPTTVCQVHRGQTCPASSKGIECYSRSCARGAAPTSWPGLDDKVLGCWCLTGMRLWRGDEYILHGRGM